MKSNRILKLQKLLFENLFTAVVQEEDLIYPSPSAQEYINLLMQIALLNQENHSKILPKIFDSTQVAFQKNTHGSHFYSIFKSVLMQCLQRQVDLVIPQLDQHDPIQVLQFLSSFVEFARKEHATNREFLRKICHAIVSKIGDVFNRIGRGEELRAIEFVSNLAMAYPDQLTLMNENCNGTIRKWLFDLFQREESTFDLKTKAIFLLPCITGNDDDTELEELLDETVFAKHLPVKGVETIYPPGSVEREAYTACVQALLDAMVATSSPTIMTQLISVTIAEEKHIMETQVRKGLGAFAPTIQSLSKVFDIFCNHRRQDQRVPLLKRFLMTTLLAETVPETAVRQFYKKHYNGILKLCDKDQRSLSERVLIDRIGGLKLLEIMISLCDKEWLQSDESPIPNPGKGSRFREIFQLCRLYMADRSIVEQNLRELFRQFQCAAFITLISILTNTQNLENQLKWFEDIIFTDQATITWKRFFNLSKDHYDLKSQEFTDPVKVKNKIVSIRNINQRIGLSSKGVIRTTTIYESSLSQDLTKFDLSHAVVRSEQDAQAIENRRALLGEITLDRLPLNDHELMPVLIAVINHMNENNLGIQSNPKVPPKWLENFLKVFNTSDRNVRLFCAQFVDNCRNTKLFKHYSQLIGRSLLKFLADETQENIDKFYVNRMNAFISDLCVLLLELSDTNSKQHFTLETTDHVMYASSLTSFLIKESYHERNDILKYNLEILKSFIELWGGQIQISNSSWLETLNRSEPLYGIQLNAIAISCNIYPWQSGDVQQYLSDVAAILKTESTRTKKAAAELFGLCLSKIFPVLDFENPIVVEVIQELKLNFRQATDAALTILYGIHRFCAEFADPFLNQITGHIPRAIQKQKLMYLEMFQSRLEKYDKTHLYAELFGGDGVRLPDLIENDSFQLISLHILNKSLSLLTPEQAIQEARRAIPMTKSSKVEVREVAYEILMFIIETYNIEEQKQIIKEIKSAALNGLLDSSEEIQARLLEFWHNYLPKSFEEKILTLLRETHDPANEENFLTHCAHLIIHTGIKDPAAKNTLFRVQVTTDAKYEEYIPETQLRKGIMFTKAPLFADTRMIEATISSSKLLSCTLKYTVSS